MSVVTSIVVAAFIGVLISTVGSLQRDSRFSLEEALSSYDFDNNTLSPGTQPPNPDRSNRHIPSIKVLIDENGNIIFMINQIFNIEDSEAQAITKLAVDTGKETGVIKEYNLRFLIKKSPNGSIRLALVDNSMEKTVIENLLLNSALIGVSTLLIFFAFSIFLARWVVKPVEDAWNKQRQFVADASHELKTPLTVILSNVSMVSGEKNITDKKTQTRLENILAEAKRMKVLVDDLLSLARSDDVKSKAISERSNFSSILNHSVLIFEPILFDIGKRLEYDIKDDLYVNADSTKLRQLTDIILDNACKYSLPGTPVTVRLKSVNKNDICLEVDNESDTISKDELSRIFERFYRLDKSRSSIGYGLGLSIAKSIVSELGGKIWANNEAQHTTISVQLPTTR